MRSGPGSAEDRRPMVLVVDDEEDLREMLDYSLSQAGYGVRTAASGARAVELARHHRFDVVLTDLKMPGMDGVATVSALHRLHPDLKIVIASGYAPEEMLAACKASGATEYLRKPFELTELEALLARLLGAD